MLKQSLNTLTVFFILVFFTGITLSPEGMAKPPEWAPAHGYHKQDKHKDKHKDKRHKPKKHKDKHHDHLHTGAVAAVTAPLIVYVPSGPVPPDIADGKCERDRAVREAVGTVVGGIIGGILGSKIGDGKGKQLATLGGVLLGAFIGNKIAAEMDEADYNCANRALEYAKDKFPVTWKNPDTNQTYTIQPVQTLRNEAGQVCREFISTITDSGKTANSQGNACRNPDGIWEVKL